MGTLERLALKLGHILKKKKIRITTAESCTGGWIAQTITGIPKSSEWFERGFVTYSNDAKREMLGVRAKTLQQYGAVSAEVAAEMAKGAIKNSHAQISIAVTGIAGPGGGSAKKPVGLVWFCFAGKNFGAMTISQNFSGTRNQIRQKAVKFALTELQHLLPQRML